MLSVWHWELFYPCRLIDSCLQGSAGRVPCCAECRRALALVLISVIWETVSYFAMHVNCRRVQVLTRTCRDPSGSSPLYLGMDQLAHSGSLSLSRVRVHLNADTPGGKCEYEEPHERPHMRDMMQ